MAVPSTSQSSQISSVLMVGSFVSILCIFSYLSRRVLSPYSSSSSFRCCPCCVDQLLLVVLLSYHYPHPHASFPANGIAADFVRFFGERKCRCKLNILSISFNSNVSLTEVVVDHPFQLMLTSYPSPHLQHRRLSMH
jgi:hypothetical protein